MSLGGPNIYPSMGPSRSLFPEPYPYPDQAGIPTELHVEPITGIKYAYIIPGPDDTAQFCGIGFGVNYPYPAVDVMKCPLGHRTPEYHNAEMSHGCGFYAYRTNDLLTANMLIASAFSFIKLLVEHYGTTISHQFGSRGQKQRVLSVILGQCARGDKRPATGFAPKVKPLVSPIYNQPPLIYAGACSEHETVSRSQMASMLSTEVQVNIF